MEPEPVNPQGQNRKNQPMDEAAEYILTLAREFEVFIAKKAILPPESLGIGFKIWPVKPQGDECQQIAFKIKTNRSHTFAAK